MHEKLWFLFLLATLICGPALAGHNVTDTRSGDTPVKRTHTDANSAGDLRMDEHGFNASASSAADVRRGMQGMMDTCAAYLDKMGGSALMDTGLVAMLNKLELKDQYPVRIEDLHSGEITIANDRPWSKRWNRM